uniref:Uncharacterized protein n=1 Tax=Ackermannviridae sp. TaxID=2831612 RepID=A0A8S5RR29_9CAUD|nr:MAG TPA: hypothetical protein [Ackermannviridae sp.]
MRHIFAFHQRFYVRNIQNIHPRISIYSVLNLSFRFGSLHFQPKRVRFL